MESTSIPDRRANTALWSLVKALGWFVWGIMALLFVVLPLVLLSPADGTPATEGAMVPGIGLASWDGPISGMFQVVEELEYHIRPGSSGKFISANRSQHLRFEFDANGFSVSSRDKSPAWSMRFELEGIGRPDDCWAPVPSARMTTQGAMLLVDHGAFMIRYQNAPVGMRQDFLVKQRPDGDAPLDVRIRLNGPLTARSTAPDEIVFNTQADADGIERTEFSYNGLLAWDANGDTLEAAMSAGPDGLLITVKDSAAVYPITIDPLSSTPDRLLEADQVGALFGACASSAGDVNGDGYSDLLVGAPGFDAGGGDEGAVFLFLGSSIGTAATPAWTHVGTQAGARSGSAVAMAGDVNGDGYSDVLIGEPFYSNGQVGEGRALLFMGSASGLGATPAWTREGDQAGARCGAALATAGDVNGDGFSDVLIGAPLYDDGQVDEGVVFVHLGSAGGLLPTTHIALQRNQGGAMFGASVSGAGDVNANGYADVIVGAPLYDNTATDEGAFFVYHGSAAGLTNTPSAARYRGTAGAQLGYSVSFAGDVNGDGYADVIVGAPMFSAAASAQQGQVLLYRGSAIGIGNTYAWTHNGGQAGARAGTSVAGLGDIDGDGRSDVAIGMPLYASGQTGEGMVRVFRGTATTSPLGGLSASASWSYQSNQVGANAGTWVAPAGDVNGDGLADLVVGAPYYDNGETDEGVALVFHGRALPPSTSAVWSIESDQADSYMGQCVSRAGDVNGDGYSDFAVGTPLHSSGQANEGAVSLYLGGPAGPATSPDWSFEGNSTNARFGHSVATAGDVNGDGYSDLIVGAPFFSNGQSEEGRAYLFLGSPSGLSPTPAWTYESNQVGARLGWSVSSAGDVNGDGFSDVVACAYMFTATQTAEGRCFLFLGSPTGLSSTPDWTYDGGQEYGFFGISVSLAGDVNGDGYGDVIVGANLYDNTVMTEGAAFLFLGSPTGLGSAPAWTVYGGQGGAELGNAVGLAGDVNGDGYSDVYVAAFRASNTQSQEGLVHIHHGGPSGPGATPVVTLAGGQVEAHLGISVSNAGDVNGDGYSDLIVGANRHSMAYLYEGGASLFVGGPAGLSPTPAWSINGGQAGAEMGYSVSGAGDVNGDGYADLVVGTHMYSNGQVREGRATLYAGNSGFGVDRPTRQFREDLVTPVQTSNTTLFGSCAWGIGHMARSPLGWAKLKLFWEVKGHGSPFTGNPVTSSTSYTGFSAGWTNSGTTGADIREVIMTPPLNSSYPAWRLRVGYHPVWMLNGQVYGPWRYGGVHDDQVPSIKVDLDLCGPLDLQWLGQWTDCVDGRPTIRWWVADAGDIVRFLIMASSDGTTWEQVAQVAPHHDDNSYVWQGDALNGPVYYRIEAEDSHGYAGTTPVMVGTPCSTDQAPTLHFIPNPASHGHVSAIMRAGFPEGSTVELLQPTGGIVRHYGPFMLEGVQQAELPLTGIAPGTYLVIARDKHGVRLTSARLLIL